MSPGAANAMGRERVRGRARQCRPMRLCCFTHLFILLVRCKIFAFGFNNCRADYCILGGEVMGTLAYLPLHQRELRGTLLEM